MKMKLAYTVASLHKSQPNLFLLTTTTSEMFATLDRQSCFLYVIYAHTTLGEHKDRDEGPVQVHTTFVTDHQSKLYRLNNSDCALPVCLCVYVQYVYVHMHCFKNQGHS